MADNSFRSDLWRMRALAESLTDDEFREQMLAIIDRWLERRDCESPWNAIIKGATKREILYAPDLILMTIENGRFAAKIKRLVDDNDGLVAKANAQGLREMRANDVEQIAQGAIKRASAVHFQEKRALALGRKQKDAHIQYFKAQCSAALVAAYGQPFDKVVADLTEIVFDCGPVSAESVRGARKDRDIRRKQ